METAAPIFDVTLENFEQDVVLASEKHVIVLDFWASWCGPCKTLMPILEKLAHEYQGRFRLGKVNIDREQEIAAMFGIRSVPTVIALKGQKPVAAFQGAQPESAVRAFLDKVVPPPGEERLAQAKAKLEAGDVQGAVDELKVALALSPALDAARVMLADIAMRDNRIEEAKNYLAQCKPVFHMDPEYQRVQARIHAAERAGQSPEAAALKARIAANPADHEARLQLAAVLAAEGQYEGALQTLLESVQIDRNWNDQAARKQMIEYFALAKDQPELVRRYRQALSATLN
ncbi:MAG: thioredoxin [Casimicrobiaceae bacterium]|nr:thioredoxin [Casimicrobiaceae bacterium]MCX8097901.1 thioredoxin [Casimicrobiaceae bacterium]MDW8313042.1 thioredoxin [Burkholderiales bacterium]